MKNNLIDSKDLSVSGKRKKKKKKAASLTVHWDINFKKTTSKACKHVAWPRAVSFLLFFEEIANPISILQIKVFYGSKKSLFHVWFKHNHGKVCILCLWPPNSLSLCFISEFEKKKENYLISSVTSLLISKWRLSKVNPQWNKSLRFGRKSLAQGPGRQPLLGRRVTAEATFR